MQFKESVALKRIETEIQAFHVKLLACSMKYREKPGKRGYICAQEKKPQSSNKDNHESPRLIFHLIF